MSGTSSSSWRLGYLKARARTRHISTSTSCEASPAFEPAPAGHAEALPRHWISAGASVLCRDCAAPRVLRPRSVARSLRAHGDLAQGRDHGHLWPVLRVQLGELLLIGHGFLEGVVLHDGPAADDLLGFGVRSIDPADLALAGHEVDGVLS